MKDTDLSSHYCLLNYPEGLDRIAEESRPYLENGLVKEGLQKIARHFESEKHVGPRFVADFEEITDTEQREIKERDAYERVNRLLES